MRERSYSRMLADPLDQGSAAGARAAPPECRSSSSTTATRRAASATRSRRLDTGKATVDLVAVLAELGEIARVGPPRSWWCVLGKHTIRSTPSRAIRRRTLAQRRSRSASEKTGLLQAGSRLRRRGRAGRSIVPSCLVVRGQGTLFLAVDRRAGMRKLALAVAALMCVSPPPAPRRRRRVLRSSSTSSSPRRARRRSSGNRASPRSRALRTRSTPRAGSAASRCTSRSTTTSRVPRRRSKLATQIFANHPAVIFGPIRAGDVQCGRGTGDAGPGRRIASRPDSYPSRAATSSPPRPRSHTSCRPSSATCARRASSAIALLVSTDATGQRSDKMLDYTLHLPDNAAMVVVAHEHFSDSDISVAAQLARIKAADPQIPVRLGGRDAVPDGHARDRRRRACCRRRS